MYRLSLLLALALTLLPGFVGAQWKATKLPDGSYECRNADGRVPASKYTGSAATIFCNGVGGGLTWFGTAEAQQTGVFRNVFPSGIPVGAGPAPPPSLSSPWLQTDIGTPPVAGTASDAQNVLTLAGSGDFHQATSAFHFVYQGKTGDWRVDFNLTSLTGAGQYRSCGPAILDSLAADVKYVYLTPSFATGKADFGGRTTAGAGVYETQTFSSANFSTGILRIEKIGSVFTGYMSTDGGMTFSTVGTSTWAPAGTFYIGVHDDSGESSTLSTCQGAMPTLTALSSSTPGTASFVTSAATVAENVGTTQICAQRAVDTSGGVTVDVQNAGTGSAISGTDFTNIFPATDGWSNGVGGQACSTLTILNRAGTQSSRTLNLVLGNATGGVTIGSPSTMQLTITDTSALKTQPGWYGLFNKTCIPLGLGGETHGCTTAEILSSIASEICPNANLVGMKLITSPSFTLTDTPGNYTGSTNRGFTAIDAILNALGGCGKYLILQTIYGTFGHGSTPVPFFPTFTIPSSCPPYDCTGGTAAGGAYGFVDGTQASQAGAWVAKIWNNDWRDLAIAATTAYCTRYASNPAFYAIGMLYWNTSLPFATPPDGTGFPPGYDETTVNNQYRTYEAAARAACPGINILVTLDFANPNPAQTSTHLAALQTNQAAMANNDVWISRGATWGQQVYTGETGSPSLIDYRHVVRYMEEIETPDMCGARQTATPAQIFDVVQNGNSVNRARWSGHFVVAMATECDPTFGWAAWKQFIQSINGKVMNMRDSTLRTPAEVKSMWCESGLTCQ